MQEEPIIEIKQETIPPPPTQNVKPATKQEYFSDNSVSLPGIMGQSGPVGFEPGMFKTKEGDTKHHKTDSNGKVHYNFYIIKTIIQLFLFVVCICIVCVCSD